MRDDIIPEKYFDSARTAVMKGDYQAEWAYETDSGFFCGGASCHGQLRNSMDPPPNPRWKWLATGGAYAPSKYNQDQQTMDGIQDFLLWVASEDSPWGKMHKGDVQLITDRFKRVRGLVLGPTALAAERYGWVYNFLLATRTVRSAGSWFKTYYYFRNGLGLNQLQSLLLCPYYSARMGLLLDGSGYWSAANNPIREGFTEQGQQLPRRTNEHPFILDVQALKNGEYNFNAPISGPANSGRYQGGNIWYSSVGWLKRKSPSEKSVFNILPVSDKVLTTKLGQKIKVIDPENVKKFAEEHL